MSEINICSETNGATIKTILVRVKTIYTAAFTLPLITSFGQIIVFKGLQRKINDIAETIQLHTLNEPYHMVVIGLFVLDTNKLVLLRSGLHPASSANSSI